MSSPTSCLLLWAVTLISPAAAAWAADFQVWPQAAGVSTRPGPDEATGTAVRLTDLTAARDAARRMAPGEKRRIILHAGTYWMTEPLVLEPLDSGLTIEAAPAEQVALSGGRRIDGWRSEGPFWSADVPEVASGRWDFRLLIVNGRFAPRARLPEQGAFKNLNQYKVPGPDEPKRKPDGDQLIRMTYRPEDLGPWLDIKNAEITVYHAWDESLVGLAGHDQAEHQVTFSAPASYPPGSFNNPDYVVWNVREGLTRPGQWYLDRSAGKVVYYPLADEEINEVEAFAPVPESLIVIAGSEAQPVRDISVRGLQLSTTNSRIVPGFFGARNVSAALALGSARDCRLDRLGFMNLAGHAIKGEACEGIIISGCEIHDIGGGGVILDGDHCTYENLLIHHVGLLHPSGVGLWVLGTHLVLRHNELHDLPYCGIVTERDDHLIESNLLYRVMQQLQDGGAIYTGDNKGVVIRGNLVRDITGNGGRHAYYIDERGHDLLIENNVSVNVAWPWHNHIGRDNIIRNNVAIAEGDLKLTFPRSSGYRLERNVLVAGGSLLIQAAPEAISTMPDNVFFSRNGQCEWEKLDGYNRADKAPLEPREGTLLADPRLLRTSPTLFDFEADSPCRARGIRPLDVSGAGRESPASR